MFNSAKQDPQKKIKRPSPSKESAVTILTSGCHFNGKLYTRGSSRIGGKIEGQIISEGLLIIEEEALISGEIKAEEAVIQGSVRGKIEATSRVELTATSRFDGDITSPVLIVNEGARFNGKATMPVRETEEKKPRLLEAVDEGEVQVAGGPEAKNVKIPEVNVRH